MDTNKNVWTFRWSFCSVKLIFKTTHILKALCNSNTDIQKMNAIIYKIEEIKLYC